MRRRRMGRRSSKRQFTKHALRHHRRNSQGNPMRGGIRL